MNLWFLPVFYYLTFSDANTATDTTTSNSPGSCAEWTGAQCGWEPNLRPMEVQLGYGENVTFYAYVQPDVSTFYNSSTGTKRPMKMQNTGMFGKFINLSPTPIHVYWDGGRGTTPVYICTVESFGSSGTATYPGHKFFATPSNNAKSVLTKWTVQAGHSLHYYDPFQFTYSKAKAALTAEQLTLYYLQLQNKIFADQYRAFTGTDWLALYGQKLPPRFHMWRADAIGQVHLVESTQNHFVEKPPQHELVRGVSRYGPRPDERERLRRYRHRLPDLHLELKVLSCAPRVFEIQNFLSDIEVDHVLDLAAKEKFERSSVQASEGSDGDSKSETRTSTNTWIPRHTDVIIDAIYQRAADVLSMNEALLRWRHKFEIPEFQESMISIAEPLQLVHYGVGEKYNSHHDFTMPGLVHLQPSRFATLLLYLNDDMEGGETAFPIWINGESSDGLSVKPERGKAVLFYSLLPDGNYDQLSLHEARPVKRGEKYLTNLWVWDPIMDHTVAGHV